MCGILYPDLLVDSIFSNPRQNVKFIIPIFFFPEQLRLVHDLGNWFCVIY